MTLPVYTGTGWASYIDGEYTEASPFSLLAAGGAQTLPNDASDTRTLLSQLPFDHRERGLYHPESQRLQGFNGDGLIVTISFRIQRQAGTGIFNTTVELEPNGGIDPEYRQDFQNAGAAAVRLSYVTGICTCPIWANNGAEVRITCDSDVNIYDIQFLIHRVHRANQFAT